MKYFLKFILLFSIACNGCVAQKCPFEIDKLANRKVYTLVNEKPNFIGGESAFLAFFLKNYNPQVAEMTKHSFIFEFVILDTGELVRPRIYGKNINNYSKEELEGIRVLLSSPRWNPGKCFNKKVNTVVFLPLKF